MTGENNEVPGTAKASVHRREWTADDITRFWNYWSVRQDHDDWYFSHFYGRGLINAARWYGILRGEVLDYGFARGLLLPRLLEQPVGVAGVEFSAGAVTEAETRNAGRGNWRGAVEATSLPTPLPAGGFDLIYCVEVFEHLLDAWVDPTASELFRLVRPGGYVVVTTPNSEDLERHLTYCPFCEAEFHRVQHLRSVTPDWLGGLLRRHGFQVPFCRGVDLAAFQEDLSLPSVTRWSLAEVPRMARVTVHRIHHLMLRAHDRISSMPPHRTFDRVARASGPHLLAIARRQA